MIGAERNVDLCIHPQYRCRMDPVHFDDRTMRDEWQNAVYTLARDIAYSKQFRSVTDFGCGSGFKLMKYFSGFKTLGYEVEPALSYLKSTYPDRVWFGNTPEVFVGDMLICADVIEHMLDPISLLRTIANSPIRVAVLSTPALEILAERGQSPRFGPPDNKSHINEWTTLEFRSFVAMHLNVVDHVVVDAAQGTQVIVASPR